MDRDSDKQDPVAFSQPGLFDNHPRLKILVLAAVFYLTLLGMCLVILVLMYRGQGA